MPRTLGVYTLGVYTLGVYSLGQRILDLDPSLPHSGGLQSGGLLSRATDFGSGEALTRMLYTLGVYTLGSYSLVQRIFDLAPHLPVLMKKYRGPLT